MKKAAVKQIFDHDFEPLFAMADAADSITISFENSFKEATRLMCWAHVKRAYAKKLCHIKNKKLETEIDKDLHSLQLAHSERVFLTLFSLLKKKYNKEIKKDQQVNRFYKK
jgi:hypothetical protein